MKSKLLSLTAAAVTIIICSCGNNAGNGNGEAPQSMVQDAQKDDGQGVGRFKNVTLEALNEKSAEQGRLVFEAKCSACHLPTDVRKVGPGLKGVTQRRKPAWILNQITNPAEMVQKDPTSKELLATYLTQMTFQDVSDEQARQILEYFRLNDKGAPEQATK